MYYLIPTYISSVLQVAGVEAVNFNFDAIMIIILLQLHLFMSEVFCRNDWSKHR